MGGTAAHACSSTGRFGDSGRVRLGSRHAKPCAYAPPRAILLGRPAPLGEAPRNHNSALASDSLRSPTAISRFPEQPM
jgi:hypothetical protein